MPLVIEFSDGLYKPTILCDYCLEPISNARDGNYQWCSPARPTSNRAAMYFTHKACCRAFESRNPDTRFCAIALELLPVYLGNNLNINWAEAKRRVAHWASVG